MNRLYKTNFYIALIHYPVLNKNGKIIASSVTNLDLHDIARVAKTYGVKAFYVITPIEDQAMLVSKIISYWTDGFGAIYNSKRSQALKLIRVSSSYSIAAKEIENIEMCSPTIVSTTARSGFKHYDYNFLRCELIKSSSPCVLAFGTAWGLSDDFLVTSDYILGSIKGYRKYNHLSVRSAVAIVLDRLLGC